MYKTAVIKKEIYQLDNTKHYKINGLHCSYLTIQSNETLKKVKQNYLQLFL